MESYRLFLYTTTTHKNLHLKQSILNPPFFRFWNHMKSDYCWAIYSNCRKYQWESEIQPFEIYLLNVRFQIVLFSNGLVIIPTIQKLDHSKWLLTMKVICPNFKWLGFQISDPFATQPLFDHFKIQTSPNFRFSLYSSLPQSQPDYLFV